MSRVTLALLLIAATTYAGGFTRNDRVALPAQNVDAELSPSQEREARDMAMRVVKRLREADDFDQVVSELYVPDFIERLLQLVRDQGTQSEFFQFCDRSVFLQASPQELRRAYIAFMNFWHQQERLDHASWEFIKLQYRLDGKDALQEHGSWGEHLKLREEAVPEEAYSLARTDPMLDALFNLIRRERAGEEKPEPDNAGGHAISIHERLRLRDFIDKLEQSIPLLRKAVATLKTDRATLVAAKEGRSTDGDWDSRDEFHIYRFEAERLEKAIMGVPVGEVMITARIYPFEMQMARIDGVLKVLAVYPDFDGD